MDVTKVKFSFLEFCKFYGQVLFLSFFFKIFLGLENPSIGCQNRALPSCNALQLEPHQHRRATPRSVQPHGSSS